MQNDESFDFSKYKEVLQAYKEINNMLSSTIPSEKDIAEQQKLSQSLKNCPKLQVPEKASSTKEVQTIEQGNNETNNDQASLNEKQEQERLFNIRENDLLVKENKLKEQEQILLKLASQLKMKEKQLQDEELRLVTEMANLENQNLKRKETKLDIETLESISFTPEEIVKETSEEGKVEELRCKVKELEELNMKLNTKATNLEEELSRFNSELNEQKYKIVKETERLVDKENSLKVREQTLVNRENKLIESTQFINSAIKSMNQMMKAKAEQDENNLKITNVKSLSGSELKGEDLTFRGFVRNLNEIKDFSNIPNQENKSTRQSVV